MTRHTFYTALLALFVGGSAVVPLQAQTQQLEEALRRLEAQGVPVIENERAPDRFREPVTVQVTNDNWLDVRIYVVSLSANVRETRSTQRIRVGRRQRKRTCWDCEREWKRMVVPLEPGRPSEARQLLRTRR